MLSPIIRRTDRISGSRAGKSLCRAPRSNERGVTIALVAAAMVGIISMAALSIDVGTLYEAKAQAQRAADAGALTAARIISTSGITGDPNNTASSWQPTCGGAGSTASLAAISITQAQSNFVAGSAIPAAQVLVTYGAGSAGASSPTCVGITDFGINPIVSVHVKQTNLPIFFARVFSLVGGNFSSTSVSATAVAEVYNPSGSGALASGMVPVQPRCVKPWVVSNIDPRHTGAGGFVDLATGAIKSPGVWPNGVIGENFDLNAACGSGTNCLPPLPNPPGSTGLLLRYVPALVSGTPSAVPTCATTTYQAAIAGCDQTTVYACGTPLGGQVDLTENPVHPVATGDTTTAVECLTNLTPGAGTGGPADTLVAATYPFQIQAGSSNPLVKNGVVNDLDPISTSNSVVTIPIYDGGALAGAQPPVTIIGFAQVFVNQIRGNGNLDVTVMNLSGCGNAAANPAVAGTSPVPIRLITPP